MSILIEIEDPTVNSRKKFMKALTILSKATKVDFSLDNHSKSEPTPYKSLQGLADSISAEVEDRLFLVWSHIVKNWMGLELNKARGDSLPMKLNGKILIDPKTGKQLTQGQWNAITKELTTLFTWLYGSSKERLVNEAIALGKVIQSYDPDKRIKTTYSDMTKKLHTEIVSESEHYKNIVTWADVHTGEYITDMTNRSRKKVVQTIMSAYQDGKTSKQLRNELFDNFGEMNRDWRRIAETETAGNFNNGYLTAELDQKKEDEDVFMIGISGAGACSFCQSHVNDHVVILLDKSPGGETKTIDGKDYTAIWPGKSNVGRKRADWWVASGTQHPHCRCTWTRYYPEIEKYTRKLKQAMES